MMIVINFIVIIFLSFFIKIKATTNYIDKRIRLNDDRTYGFSNGMYNFDWSLWDHTEENNIYSGVYYWNHQLIFEKIDVNAVFNEVAKRHTFNIYKSGNEILITLNFTVEILRKSVMPYLPEVFLPYYNFFSGQITNDFDLYFNKNYYDSAGPTSYKGFLKPYASVSYSYDFLYTNPTTGLVSISTNLWEGDALERVSRINPAQHVIQLSRYAEPGENANMVATYTVDLQYVFEPAEFDPSPWYDDPYIGLGLWMKRSDDQFKIDVDYLYLMSNNHESDLGELDAGAFNWIKNMITAIAGSFLAIRLYKNLTVGILLAIPLTITLLAFVIGLIRGRRKGDDD